MVKQLLRRAPQTVAPRTAIAVMAARSRAHSHVLIREWGLRALNERLVAELGRRVVSGPFRGLVLTDATLAEHIGPFLLGTYESELHPTWERVFEQRFDQVLDVGAKFGYYAVGLAIRYPEAESVTFDVDWWARRATREVARANGVEQRVRVEGFCSPEWIARHARPRAFVISDCEGFEDHLSAGAAVPALRTATMIIEVHEPAVPGVTQRLLERFRATHEITTIEAHAASEPPAELPPTSLTREELTRASQELRGVQSWLYLRPRS